jgi:hypothetical protein
MCTHNSTDSGSTLLRPDTVLQNRYCIVRQLGKGGMSAVEAARALALWFSRHHRPVDYIACLVCCLLALLSAENAARDGPGNRDDGRFPHIARDVG